MDAIEFKPPAPVPGTIKCPVCRQRVDIAEPVCPECGFPFTCDLTPIDTPARAATMAAWRILLAIGAVLFLLTSGIFLHSGYQEYHGYTQAAIAHLEPLGANAIRIEGPPAFVQRTGLALALMELRAPDTYWRMQDSVTSIEFLSDSYLRTEEGRKVPLERIGALATPATGRVQVLPNVAFPSGLGELWDRDVYSYAGVLVHELRHIELHSAGRAPGGWEEEVLCEQAAYSVLTEMDAPLGVLARYQAYLAAPQAGRYQHWYDWYKYWE